MLRQYVEGRPNVALLTCDFCKQEFERHINATKTLKKPRHYCSIKCQRSDMGNVMRVVCTSHHGCENYSQLDDVKRKRKEKITPEIQAMMSKKRLATLQERYATTNPWEIPGVREVARYRCLEKHGVEHPSQRPVFRAYMGSPQVRENIKRALMEKYGVDNPRKIIEVKRRQRQWLIDNWRNVIHARFKANGTYGSRSSRAEERLMTLLTAIFGVDDIERQVPFEGQLIDFHVKSIDTWIQVDGVYWHGLDRPIEEIRASTKSRDTSIARTWERDRQFDEHCKQNNVHLVRLTDTEAKRINEATLRGLFNA